MDKKPTVVDVAEIAGVSPSTVSRVLNGSSRVAPETASRVMESVEQLGYRRNRFASALRGAATHSIGVLVPHLEKDFYGRIVTAIERTVRAAGFHMVCTLGHDDHAMERQALETFKERQVDGLVLVTENLTDAEILSHDASPVVVINRLIPGMQESCVRLDNASGAYRATKHLLDLGHTRVAHIMGPRVRGGVRDRFSGYVRALAEAGVVAPEGLTVEADFSIEAGREATWQLLASEPFTAIFASDDLQAIGALAALREHGISVPRDVSVIGFDDIPFSAFTDPPLSTIHYPVTELGEAAARALLAEMDEDGHGEDHGAVVLEGRLMVRASTARAGS